MTPEVECGICGALLEFVLEARRQGGPRRSDLVEVFGPTVWRQRPHRCPPRAIDAWARIIANH